MRSDAVIRSVIDEMEVVCRAERGRLSDPLILHTAGRQRAAQHRSRHIRALLH